MNRVIAAALFAVAWGVLSFGAVYPWAYWPLIIVVASVGTSGLVTDHCRSARFGTNTDAENQDGPSRRATRYGFPLTLATLAVATLAQLVPLSPTIVASISPVTSQLQWQYHGASTPATASGRTTLGRASAGGEAIGRHITHGLSISPGATRVALAHLVCLSCFLLGLAAMLSRTGARQFAAGIVAIGVLVAVIAIVQRPLYAGKIYGFWRPRFDLGPFGPFVNENHFAGWMMMALALGIGYFCGGMARGMRGVKSGWRNRLLWFSSPDASKLLLGGFALIVMAVSLVLSFSRSGIACMTLALILGVGLVGVRLAGGSRRALAAGYLTFVLVAALAWVGVDAVASEFAVASWDDVGGRLGAWRDTIRIISDFPLTGTGLNTYGMATFVYRASEVGQFHFRAAHNDYLQLAAEGGLLLGIPALLTIGIFVRIVRQRFREPTDEPTYWLRVGAVTGIVAIGFQEIIDFSLQIPGNAVLFCVLAAIAIHQPPAGANRRAVLATRD